MPTPTTGDSGTINTPAVAVDGALEAACSAVHQAVQAEAETKITSTDPTTFPSATVAAAVQWFESAGVEAIYRFETIYRATLHHAAAAAGAANWVDPAAKEELVASVDKARNMKLDAIEDLEDATLKLKRAERREDAEKCKEIAITLRAAKTKFAHANKHNQEMQSTFANVMRDHFPELSVHPATKKDQLIVLLG